MSTPDEEASISLPSIAFVAVLGYLIYRYFFAASSSSSSSQSTTTTTPRPSSARNTPRFTAAQVDQVATMFPQLSRRDIMWDLHRNRGSVAATTERVLMGGRLDPAPPSFQPILPASPTAGIGTGATSAPTSPISPVATSYRADEPDLITRYNLQSRIAGDTKGKGKEREQTDDDKQGWASSKDERAAMMKRRRDEMILGARRRMLERDAATSTTTTDTSLSPTGGMDGDVDTSAS